MRILLPFWRVCTVFMTTKTSRRPSHLFRLCNCWCPSFCWSNCNPLITPSFKCTSTVTTFVTAASMHALAAHTSPTSFFGMETLTAFRLLIICSPRQATSSSNVKCESLSRFSFTSRIACARNSRRARSRFDEIQCLLARRSVYLCIILDAKVCSSIADCIIFRSLHYYFRSTSLTSLPSCYIPSSAGEMRLTATLFGRGLSTCLFILDQFCSAVQMEMHHAIKLPSPAECEAIAQAMLRARGMPGCIGAMDGKHFEVTAGASDNISFQCYKRGVCWSIAFGVGKPHAKFAARTGIVVFVIRSTRA